MFEVKKFNILVCLVAVLFISFGCDSGEKKESVAVKKEVKKVRKKARSEPVKVIGIDEIFEELGDSGFSNEISGKVIKFSDLVELESKVKEIFGEDNVSITEASLHEDGTVKTFVAKGLLTEASHKTNRLNLKYALPIAERFIKKYGDYIGIDGDIISLPKDSASMVNGYVYMNLLVNGSSSSSSLKVKVSDLGIVTALDLDLSDITTEFIKQSFIIKVHMLTEEESLIIAKRYLNEYIISNYDASRHNLSLVGVIKPRRNSYTSGPRPRPKDAPDGFIGGKYYFLLKGYSNRGSCWFTDRWYVSVDPLIGEGMSVKGFGGPTCN